jgi:poly(3-hydroxyalkanoate) synthetase
MKGFPAITVDNQHVMARYDNVLIDAHAWAAGAAEAGDKMWPAVQQPLEHALKRVDGRHPLAMAHLVNHPPSGEQPNVLLAPFDLKLNKGVCAF